MSEQNAVANANTNVPAEAQVVMGFEEARQEDQVIPRIKVINALSPERKEKLADEGDLLNSLTKEVIDSDAAFIPIKVYYSNIEWNPDRNADTRMLCRSVDGRIGVTCDGDTRVCKDCKRNQFDNTKQGKDAQPTCTAYMNFLGFFSGVPMPVVLSFARTNYNEGKKMLSVAKSLMRSIWDYSYTLGSKLLSKNGNDWYIITSKLGGETSELDRTFAVQMYKAFEKAVVNADYEELGGASTGSSAPVDTTTQAEI